MKNLSLTSSHFYNFKSLQANQGELSTLVGLISCISV